KDVVDVFANETVRVVAKFEDFADPTNAYMYHCHLLDHEDHGMMHQFIVLDPATTGLSKPTLRSVAVFPNPASDNIIIEYSLANDFEVEISDLTGKPVANYKNTKEINVSSIPEGLYFIRVSDASQVVSGKFVKY
ncbi:MAG: T9SS type A sorting domain-containing protein, partial [Cytophagaceae bacterium]